MAKTSSVYVRLEPKVKEESEAILNRLGIPMSHAISLFLQQVILQRGIPFELKLPPVPAALGELSEEEFNAGWSGGWPSMRRAGSAARRRSGRWQNRSSAGNQGGISAFPEWFLSNRRTTKRAVAGFAAARVFLSKF